MKGSFWIVCWYVIFGFNECFLNVTDRMAASSWRYFFPRRTTLEDSMREKKCPIIQLWGRQTWFTYTVTLGQLGSLKLCFTVSFHIIQHEGILITRIVICSPKVTHSRRKTWVFPELWSSCVKCWKSQTYFLTSQLFFMWVKKRTSGIFFFFFQTCSKFH